MGIGADHFVDCRVSFNCSCHSSIGHRPPRGTVLRDRKGVNLSAMWKTKQIETTSASPAVSEARPTPASAFSQPVARVAPSATGQAISGRGYLQGRYHRIESLFIEGRVEGSINLPGYQVTLDEAPM